MEDELTKLFTLQSNCMNSKTFQNEFETMRTLFDLMPQKIKQYVRQLSMTCLEFLKENENAEFLLKDNSEKVQESKNLRQQGNRFFTAKGDKRNILGACRLYNDAIYAALDTKGQELALGFANRAAALQIFGYYQQAYDDCVCALETGYPESLRHKIIVRQAYCSIKMRDLTRAAKHLSVLKDLNLSAGFSKELKELLQVFDELKDEVENEKGNSNKVKEIHFNRDTQEIITTNNERCMKAKCSIDKNKLIFTERATAIIPIANTRQMCHQCATVNFIPIPCLHCRGRVNYCSLKCQEEHAGIHKYECPAYRMQLFAHIGIAHLALRIVLDNGLFSILDELQLDSKHSAADVWRMLSEGGEIWNNNDIPYVKSLRMITHLGKMSQMNINWFALVAHLLMVYLKNYTKYFDVLKARNRNIDWELLTASLILRHIGQSIPNGTILTTIYPRPLTLMTNTEFHMLNENVWTSPWHVKLGCLHFFSYYDALATLMLPYLNLCNHSCVPSFGIKFSGRFISTYASRNLKKGAEITNCYRLDYRKDRREARREVLEETYHFKCHCEDCGQPEIEDVEFNKFHQYRCTNNNCGQIFVPKVSETPVYNIVEYENKGITNLLCDICGYTQTFKWCYEAKYLLRAAAESTNRRRLYKIFKESERYLVGMNADRCLLAQKIVFECFQLQWINIPLNDEDYPELIDMIKYVLNIMRNESSVNSLSYATEMLYLWDLIAQRKYKCSKAEMDEMLWALTIISDDLKEIFLNYYNDYMKDLEYF